jgi:hypothetical protein
MNLSKKCYYRSVVIQPYIWVQSALQSRSINPCCYPFRYSLLFKLLLWYGLLDRYFTEYSTVFKTYDYALFDRIFYNDVFRTEGRRIGRGITVLSFDHRDCSIPLYFPSSSSSSSSQANPHVDICHQFLVTLCQHSFSCKAQCLILNTIPWSI